MLDAGYTPAQRAEKGKHMTFDHVAIYDAANDGEQQPSIDTAAPVPGPSQGAQGRDVTGDEDSSEDEDDDDDDDDDEAPAEESNVNQRDQAKRREEEAAEAKRQASLKRKQAAQARAAAAEAVKAEKAAQAKGAADTDEAANKKADEEAGESEDESDEEDADGESDDKDMGDEYDIEEDDLDADLDEEDEDEDDEAEEETAAAAPSNPNRLDPALFASAFARKGDARAAAILRGQGQAQGQGNVDKAAEKRAARKEARRRKVRKGGVVQGRDGMPMRRLKDGRTIVRALESTPSSTVSAPASAGAEQFVEPALPYVPLDPSLSLPNKRARAFKKRRLQLQRSTSSSGTSSSSSSSSANKKAKAATKNWDDPLGLADPEFMPGGKFAMKGAVPRTPRSEQEQNGRAKRKRAGRRGEGGRVDAGTSLAQPQKRGPALGFARSLG